MGAKGMPLGAHRFWRQMHPRDYFSTKKHFRRLQPETLLPNLARLGIVTGRWCSLVSTSRFVLVKPSDEPLSGSIAHMCSGVTRHDPSVGRRLSSATSSLFIDFDPPIKAS